MTRYERVLESWLGTPYMPGQARKGAGVDCIGFVFAVLDEMLGVKTKFIRMPADACVHAPHLTEQHAETLRACYATDEVEVSNIRPGDVVVSGPEKGGPGHVLIVGTDGFLWHATHPRVHKTPLRGVRLYGHTVRRAFRVRGLDVTQ